jgi:hypothetical protein
MLQKKFDDMSVEGIDLLGLCTHEHKIHVSKSAIDTKGKAIHLLRNGQLSMEWHLEVSEKDEGADHRERVKAHTIHQLKYCRKNILGQMFGFSLRRPYPKLIKGTDQNDGRRITWSFARSILVNTKVNMVALLPTSTKFVIQLLDKCGQHIDGILFLYEETMHVLTIKLRYRSV